MAKRDLSRRKTAQASRTGKPGSRIALYPGTFDPITFGHVDIIHRAAALVDHLIIAVSENAGKEPLFSLSDRVALVRQAVNGTRNIEVVGFDTLLMHFAAERGAHLIVRGLRAVSDFEYEFQMAGMNHRLDSSVETVFLMASEKHHFISSRFVKEIARLDGDITSFVPPFVVEALGRALGGN
ncbi:MAG TPA: pantetheine-phosphate adenylyltransferase [Dongiaceae bacterium]|jgi:pantetheine-phosphate adenylyltransferase|nr:pantetheine-phosphate adenylyltransferase [Dongiaceae bacterium]